MNWLRRIIYNRFLLSIRDDKIKELENELSILKKIVSDSAELHDIIQKLKIENTKHKENEHEFLNKYSKLIRVKHNRMQDRLHKQIEKYELNKDELIARDLIGALYQILDKYKNNIHLLKNNNPCQ